MIMQHNYTTNCQYMRRMISVHTHQLHGIRFSGREVNDRQAAS